MTTTATAADHRRFRAARTNSEETNTILAFRSFMGTFRHRLLHHLGLIILVFCLFLIVLLLCVFIVISLFTKEGFITAPPKVSVWSLSTRILVGVYTIGEGDDNTGTVPARARPRPG
jgi:threonine/homoserine/homoserine lactone efflux protein